MYNEYSVSARKEYKKKYEKDHGILRYVPKNILFYFYWGVCSYNTTDELLATKNGDTLG